MASLKNCLIILLSCQVGRLLAIEYCYNSYGSYTGYCSSDQDCCNDGYNCCSESTLEGGAIAGIVIAIFIVVVIGVVVCIILAKKKNSRPVHAAPVIHTTTVQSTSTPMYPNPAMGGPNPPMYGQPMGGPNPPMYGQPMGGPKQPMGAPNYPPPYDANPVYPPPPPPAY